MNQKKLKAQADEKNCLDPLPEDPPRMSGGYSAESEYRRIVPELTKLGHVHAISLQCLVNYCEAFALAKDALDIVSKEGSVIVSAEKGTQYMHPAYNIWASARSVMEKEAKNLGMTPASLALIGVVPKNSEQKNSGKVVPGSFLT